MANILLKNNTALAFISSLCYFKIWNKHRIFQLQQQNQKFLLQQQLVAQLQFLRNPSSFQYDSSYLCLMVLVCRALFQFAEKDYGCILLCRETQLLPTLHPVHKNVHQTRSEINEFVPFYIMDQPLWGKNQFIPNEEFFFLLIQVAFFEFCITVIEPHPNTCAKV